MKAKKVYFIGGTMGVGKTSVCQILKRKLDKSVFLDGDWCWDAHPFVVNPETAAERILRMQDSAWRKAGTIQ